MLGITQPVVTRLIADFEERIALQLFRRNKGRLEPTPEATLLIEDVHRSLVSIERIANVATNAKALKLTRLEIAAAPSMALTFLPRAISSFTKEYSETLISLQTHSSSTVIDMVLSGRCDVGFIASPTLKTATMQSELLVSARMVAAIPINHHLANKKILTPENFDGESFISLSPLMNARTKIDSVMLAHAVNRRLNVETQLSSAVIKLVEAGAGLSLIEPLSAAAYTGELIKFIPFEPSISTDYSMVISPRMKSTLVLKPFLDHSRNEIRKMLPTKLLIKN